MTCICSIGEFRGKPAVGHCAIDHEMRLLSWPVRCSTTLTPDLLLAFDTLFDTLTGRVPETLGASLRRLRHRFEYG
jgi:hypothetical protein